MAGLALFTMLLFSPIVTSSVVPEYHELQRKYTMVVSEVEDLRETVKTMKEDMARVKRISRALDALCEELRSGDEVFDSGKTKETDVIGTESDHKKEMLNEFPIQFTAVAIENNTFQVGYGSDSGATASITHRGQDDTEVVNLHPRHNVFSGGHGVINDSSSAEAVSVHLEAGGYSASIYFSFSNDTEVALPSLGVSTDVGNEIVFEPGHSTEVKIRANKIDAIIYNTEIHYELFFVDRNESETVVTTIDDFPGIIERTEKKEFNKYDEYTIVINEDKKDYEGILRVEILVEDYDEFSPISYWYVRKLIKVRRSNHCKPFPDGFLGFLGPTYISGIRTCYLGSVCVMKASIVGNDPKDITLWSVDGSARTQVGIKTKKFISENILEVKFETENISVSDVGNYVYVGTSLSGAVIQKEFVLSAYAPYVLLQENSEVVKDTSDELIVKCVGRGYPDPVIHFYNGTLDQAETEITEGSSISIATKEESDGVVSATLTLNPRPDNINHIYCSVRQMYDLSTYGDGFQIYGRHS